MLGVEVEVWRQLGFEDAFRLHLLTRIEFGRTGGDAYAEKMRTFASKSNSIAQHLAVRGNGSPGATCNLRSLDAKDALAMTDGLADVAGDTPTLV